MTQVTTIQIALLHLTYGLTAVNIIGDFGEQVCLMFPFGYFLKKLSQCQNNLGAYRGNILEQSIFLLEFYDKHLLFF